MNESKAQELINKEIAELHARIGGKAARKQLPAAKWQIAKLNELGILELMPAKFGHTDAKVVIEAATDSGHEAVTPYGEGEKGLPHPLYVAINKAETQSEIIQLSGHPHQNQSGGVNAYSTGSEGTVWYSKENGWCWCISGISETGLYFETDDMEGYKSKAEAIAAMHEWMNAEVDY